MKVQTPMTRSNSCSSGRGQQQWQGRHLGNFISRILYLGQHYRLASCSKSGFATGINDGFVLYRRRLPWHGAFMLAANFGFYTAFKPLPTRQRLPRASVPFDFGTPDGYVVLFESRLAEKPEQTLSRKSQHRSSHDQITHTTYDDYWKVRDLVSSPEEHQMRGDDCCGRLV